MKVLVCGGRDFTDAERIAEVLSACHRARAITLLIHGGARGADRLAGEWAQRIGIPVQEFEAQWEEQGRAAGPIRNQRMLDEGRPDLVIAFPGGRGTADTVHRARQARVPVVEVPPIPPEPQASRRRGMSEGAPPIFVSVL